MATRLDRDGIYDGKSRPSPALARIPAYPPNLRRASYKDVRALRVTAARDHIRTQ